MDGDLVALSVHLLDCGIVGVLVRHEEGCLDITAVWIFALAIEDIFVEADVVVVDGVIEGDCDHLRYILGWEVAGYRGTVLRAEAVGQGTYGGIARWSSIGIIVHVWNVKKIAIVLMSQYYLLNYNGFFLLCDTTVPFVKKRH